MELQFSLDNIREIATTFWKNTGGHRVFAFHGEMGTGKTTFIHALCDVKGVTDAVTSPTFSIINQYNYREDGKEKKIFHLDLYRLEGEEEAVRTGIEDCLYSNHICLVEWPDKAAAIFPPDTLDIYLDFVDENNRKLRTDDKIG
jgi:tRNA threonylcarbamoyladenosine biosynthesis protein TsaE